MTLGPHAHDVPFGLEPSQAHVTVAILAQGTLWAVALAQAFFFRSPSLCFLGLRISLPLVLLSTVEVQECRGHQSES